MRLLWTLIAHVYKYLENQINVQDYWKSRDQSFTALTVKGARFPSFLPMNFIMLNRNIGTTPIMMIRFLYQLQSSKNLFLFYIKKKKIGGLRRWKNYADPWILSLAIGTLIYNVYKDTGEHSGTKILEKKYWYVMKSFSIAIIRVI